MEEKTNTYMHICNFNTQASLRALDVVAIMQLIISETENQ